MKKLIKGFTYIAIIVGLLGFSFVLADVAATDYEETRLETLKTNYATMPTEEDGSFVVYPTMPDIDE